MKTISSLKLRTHLGEVLDELRYTRRIVLVLKNNHPIAKIVPLENEQKSLFNPNKIFALTAKLSPKYRLDKFDKELFNLVGTGSKTELTEEKQAITEYLQDKHA